MTTTYDWVMTINDVRLLAITIIVLSGCSGEAALGHAPAPRSPLSSRAPDASPQAPSASSPSPAAPVAQIQKPLLKRTEVPAALTDDEQRELGVTCKPLVDRFQTAGVKARERAQASADLRAAKAEPPGVEAWGRLNLLNEALEATLATPSPLAAPRRERCRELFERGMRVYAIDTLGAEARVRLDILAAGLAKRFAEERTLCPAPTDPMPSPIPGFYHRMSTSDWSQDPAWHCLGEDYVERTSVQMEVTITNARATLVARGIPFPKEGTIVEWKVDAEVKDGRLVTTKPELVR